MAEIMVHQVELLGVPDARITDGSEADGQRVVADTIRPDLPASFRPHNLAFSLDQAERLFHDLRVVLTKAGVQSLMVLLVLGFGGCSSSVEVEHESSRPNTETGMLTTEKSRTAVSVDLFRDQGPVLTQAGQSVGMPSDGVLVVEGCVHFHEHLHVYLNEDDRNSERVALEVVREWANGDCGRDRRH